MNACSFDPDFDEAELQALFSVGVSEKRVSSGGRRGSLGSRSEVVHLVIIQLLFDYLLLKLTIHMRSCRSTSGDPTTVKSCCPE